MKQKKQIKQKYGYTDIEKEPKKIGNIYEKNKHINMYLPKEVIDLVEKDNPGFTHSNSVYIKNYFLMVTTYGKKIVNHRIQLDKDIMNNFWKEYPEVKK